MFRIDAFNYIVSIFNAIYNTTMKCLFRKCSDLCFRHNHNEDMKLKKKIITDLGGSNSQSRAITRETLWGIVERISRDAEAADEVQEPLDVVDTSAGLPVSFSSGKNKKRKRACQLELQRNKNWNKSRENGSDLPTPKYNGTLLEEHVYYVRNNGKFDQAMVRIYGVGHDPTSSLMGSQIVVATVIGHCDTSSIGSSVTIPRTELVAVPAAERAHAHQLVQQDEQRILQIGMPAGIHLKYWDQRYRLLSRFDRGVKLDAESWYSITPEAVARHVTASCLGRSGALKCKMEKVLDCFSGCGGNTIPFLVQNRQVISVDYDPTKLENLR